MPSQLTASHSSRIQKPGDRPATLRRTTSSPFSRLLRTKPNHHLLRTKSLDSVENDIPRDGKTKQHLPAAESPVSPAAKPFVKTIPQAITHVQGTMFSEVPERAPGMNSTRIAEVLNFRKRLPQMASLAHLYGLLAASTQTERDIAALIAAGHVHKIQVYGRGNEVSGVGEFLVLTEDIEALIRANSVLTDLVADKFIQILCQNPRSTVIPVNHLTPTEITKLRSAGFLVSPGIVSRKPRVPAAAGTHATAIPTISRQASGTTAAVGGENAFDSLGGNIGGARASSTASASPVSTNNSLTLSLPYMGAYIRLIDDARTHLVELLGKSQNREAPLYLLKERWDGGGGSGDLETNKISAAKRMRGEFVGVLPGRTNKWKQFYGLNFEWILDECLGAGLVELFETNSVGYGVRTV